jgi:translation initiation factor IF-3
MFCLLCAFVSSNFAVGKLIEYETGKFDYSFQKKKKKKKQKQ